MSGITPAAFEYIGTPISVAIGTAKILSAPATLTINSVGTYPWIKAPTPTPKRI
jgi:hypothetical protein